MSELDENRLRRGLQRAAGDVDGVGDPAATWRRASHRVAQRRRRRRAGSAAAVVLVVALGAGATLPRMLAPAGDDASGVADVQSEPGPESQPGTTGQGGSQPGDAEVATATCRNQQDGFAVDYPTRWEPGGSACAQFGPDPDAAEAGTGGAQLEGVRVYGDVLDVSFDTHAQRILGDGNADVVTTQRLTVDGRRALRWESVSRGAGAAPQGTRSTGWVIELGARRVLVLSVNDLEGPEAYRDDVAGLDRMARSVRVVDGT